METKKKVRDFLSRFIGNAKINDEDNIFDKKLVNSLFAMQLVVFVENEFGIVLQNEDLNLENFKSINSITDLIELKKDVA